MFLLLIDQPKINSVHENYIYDFKSAGVLLADGHSVYYRWQWPISLSIFIGYITNTGCS